MARDSRSPGDAEGDDPLCPLCGRPMPEASQSRHHLVPRSRKGRETVALHRICHRKIHSLFTERELAKHYNSIEALLVHPDILAFRDWVATKPADFYAPTYTSRKKRSRRA